MLDGTETLLANLPDGGAQNCVKGWVCARGMYPSDDPSSVFGDHGYWRGYFHDFACGRLSSVVVWFVSGHSPLKNMA